MIYPLFDNNNANLTHLKKLKMITMWHMINTTQKQALANKTLASEALAKVPEVTLIFWLIKILATTLGETGGDAVSMSMNLGYLLSTAIFAVIFIIAVMAQIKAKQFHPTSYWVTIIATTTVGTNWQILQIARWILAMRAVLPCYLAC